MSAIVQCHNIYVCELYYVALRPEKSQDRGPESYSSNAKNFDLRRRLLSHGLILISPKVYIVAQNLRYIK